jgi:glycosyltransferase involved in cell wall biosynthesis
VSAIRAAVLFHRYGPYHLARLAAAGRRGPVVGIELSGQTREYAWDHVPGSDGFRRITLVSDAEALPARELADRLTAALADEKPDVVFVNGWAGGVPATALRWCLRAGVPAVVMSESTALDERRRTWKELIKRQVVRCFSAALVGGTRHAEYATALGVPAGRVFTGYDAVDNDYFAHGADAVRLAPGELRTRLGLPERYFLASNRFIAKKNLPGLLRAFARYRRLAGASSWDLVLLGDGPQRAELDRLVADLGLGSAVLMPGFQQYPNLPAYYGLAGAFVHASTAEQWGLVVNEAMASGLPVIVSERCGCAPDLVLPGKTGFTFDPTNEVALAELLARVASDLLGGAEMGRAARAHVAGYGPDAFADGFWRAAGAARGAGRPRAGLRSRFTLFALGRS